MEQSSDRSAFIVKGPPTYMNAEEAWQEHWGKRDGSILVICVPEGNAYNKEERLRSVIDDALWERIYWVRLKSNVLYRRLPNGKFARTRMSPLRRLPRLLHDRIALDRVARAIGPAATVFSGHNYPQEHLAARLNPRRLYLLDAGVSILSRVSRTGYIDYRQSLNKIFRIVFALLGYRVVHRPAVRLFTAYSSELSTHHKTEPNSYQRIVAKVARSRTSGDLFWISAPLVDRYGVAPSAYAEYVRTAVEMSGHRTEDVVFIPHPGKESDATVASLAASLTCRVDDRLIPVEMKLVRRDALPRACISPFSSSLKNLERIVGSRVALYSAWHWEFWAFADLAAWRSALESAKDLHVRFLDVNDCLPLFGIRNVGGELEQFTSITAWAEAKKLIA